MNVVDQMLTDGQRLFRLRSLVPLALVPVVILALPDSSRAAAELGDSGCLIVQWIAFAVAVTGLLIRCAAVAYAPDGTSSRDTRALRAPSLNTTGMYSMVRHPLYLGAGLMWIGVAMSLRVWWLVVIVALAYWLYVERLMVVEESFLAQTFPMEFPGWAARTRAFLPRLSGWIPATGSLQIKRLSSEHNGLLTIGIAFPLLQYLENVRQEGLPWHEWYSKHHGLMLLFEITVVISIVSAVLRHVPWSSAPPRESKAEG